jgi:hypothetical protein
MQPELSTGWCRGWQKQHSCFIVHKKNVKFANRLCYMKRNNTCSHKLAVLIRGILHLLLGMELLRKTWVFTSSSAGLLVCWKNSLSWLPACFVGTCAVISKTLSVSTTLGSVSWSQTSRKCGHVSTYAQTVPDTFEHFLTNWFLNE